jgi:hypothetical protein
MSKLLLLAAAALAGAASPAAALVTAKDPQSVVKALQAAGYNAQLGTDQDGDPTVASSASGTKFDIFFYGCTQHKDCKTVQFYTGYTLKERVSLEKINAFNRDARFGRGYLDKVDDPCIRMEVDLDDGGMSDALFIDNIEFWTSIRAEFERQIGFRS